MNREELTETYLRFRGCINKKSFKNKKIAKTTASDTNRKNLQNEIDHHVKAYRCKYCKNYHVGHDKKKPKVSDYTRTRSNATS